MYSGLSVLAALAVAALLRTAQVAERGLRLNLLAIDLLLPAFFLVGLGATNMQWKVQLRLFYKVICVTLVAGVASIPVIYLLSRDEQITALIKAQIEGVSQVFAGVAAEGVTGTAATGILSDPDALVQLIQSILLRNYLFMYFAILSGSVWMGISVGNRTVGRAPRKFADFFLPEKMIWPLLFSWAIVLLDTFFPVGKLRYAAWNIGLIFLLTYGVQGIGIIQTLFDRRGVGRGIRAALFVGVTLMLFWPGANLLIIVGFPILGISELWIHYRTSEKGVDES